MFVTIRRYQGKPGQTEETVSRVKTGLLPILTRQQGFASYTAVDAGNDVAVSVSTYESRAAAEAANQAAASWVQSNLGDLVGAGEVTMGEALATATAEDRNLEIVRGGYEAFGRGDIQAVLATFDDQITWQTPGPPELPLAGTRRGLAQVAQFFQLLTDLLDITRFEPRQFIARGDQVIVIGDDTARVKATGRSLEFRWTHVFTLRNGKIVALEEFSDASALVAELISTQARL